MKTYKERKEEAREKAILFQYKVIESQNISWGEVVEMQSYFYELGKRYGLLKEFRKNAIC